MLTHLQSCDCGVWYDHTTQEKTSSDTAEDTIEEPHAFGTCYTYACPGCPSCGQSRGSKKREKKQASDPNEFRNVKLTSVIETIRTESSTGDYHISTPPKHNSSVDGLVSDRPLSQLIHDINDPISDHSPLGRELQEARSLLDRLSRREDVGDDFWASVGLTRSFADRLENSNRLEQPRLPSSFSGGHGKFHSSAKLTDLRQRYLTDEQLRSMASETTQITSIVQNMVSESKLQNHVQQAESNIAEPHLREPGSLSRRRELTRGEGTLDSDENMRRLDREKQRSKNQKRSRSSAGTYERTINHSNEGQDIQAYDDPLDDLDNTARRLRRRVRGPGERSSPLVFQDPEERGLDNTTAHRPEPYRGTDF